MMNLNELRASKPKRNSLIYKEKMKKIHDSKIKNRIFNVGTSSYLKRQVQDLRIAPDYEDSCARGFVLRSLELQSLA
ncbi:hypothetical protein Tco_0992114 [Tanacetum coccineum]|uniref:Uncharacterized protein n=1 Tax=Tanacetum coccineum TaxID=301880 RepID=A0ABQ5F2I1_9ASTR